MFEGVLMKNKFCSKCKSAIKLTKTRTETIMRKRNAMQKHLKKDIAELLRNGLDINAYDRTEGLLRDLNKSACYDLIGQFCDCVLNHLSGMKKEGECPEECREAVQSLIVAAARFADLPELRELRNLFEGKYGNSLAAYVNQEKLKAPCPTKDMKLQLLQDIALESGLQWDSNALGQMLYRPPPFKEEQDSKSYNDEDESIRENIDPNDQIKKSNSERNVFEEKANDKKPFNYRFVPLPYTNQNTSKTETNLKVPNCVASDHANHHQNDSVGEEHKPKPRSVPQGRLKPPSHLDNKGGTDGGAGMTNSTQELGSEPSLKILMNKDGQDQQQLGEEERMMHDNTQPTRSSPLQPDTGHVHPKLPDYDEFVARLASSKGK